VAGSGNGDLQGSVVAVENGLTTLAVSATDAVGNNWSTYETVTVGPTYFGIVEHSTDASYSLGCTVTVPTVTAANAIPTCTDSLVAIGVGDSCGEGDDSGDYEKRGGRTVFHSPAIPTAVVKRDISCSSGTEVVTSTGVSVYIYTVILTAGTEKLTATGAATNSATQTASATGTATATNNASGTATNKASVTTTAANTDTACPAPSTDASSSSTLSTRTVSNGSLGLHVPIVGVILALAAAIAL
ncbi:UNVERIFIED_CONTAM: hypothetical protein C3P00_19140, partial [Clostridioides difficile]